MKIVVNIRSYHLPYTKFENLIGFYLEKINSPFFLIWTIAFT
jgi:hypothetical protein